MKIVKSLDEYGLLIKGVSETVKNKAKEEKGALLGMILGTLDARLLGNMLAGKGVVKSGDEVIQPSEGASRARQDF